MLRYFHFITEREKEMGKTKVFRADNKERGWKKGEGILRWE